MPPHFSTGLAMLRDAEACGLGGSIVAKWVGSVMATIGVLAGVSASATTSPPTELDCVVVGTWACEKGTACKPGGGVAGQRYGFDLAAMTYQTPNDHGAITDLETNDSGFMTFVLGGERRYVHKNAGESGAMTSFVYVSTRAMHELRCTAHYATASEAASQSAARDRRALAGHYYLSGVMETGSELLLRPDGRFAWFMSYGAADREAEGTWRIDGDAVLLDARVGASGEPAFRQLRLPIDHGALLMTGVTKGRYERHP